MMVQIRKKITALEERMENSEFQQRIYDWQDAHPVATERIDKISRVVLSVLCHILFLLGGLMAAVLAAQIHRYGLDRTETLLMAVSLFAVWFGIRTLRSL